MCRIKLKEPLKDGRGHQRLQELGGVNTVGCSSYWGNIFVCFKNIQRWTTTFKPPSEYRLCRWQVALVDPVGCDVGPERATNIWEVWMPVSTRALCRVPQGTPEHCFLSVDSSATNTSDFGTGDQWFNRMMQCPVGRCWRQSGSAVAMGGLCLVYNDV